MQYGLRSFFFKKYRAVDKVPILCVFIPTHMSEYLTDDIVIVYKNIEYWYVVEK